MKILQGRKWQEGEDWFVSPQKYASLFSSFFNRSEARPKVPTIYLYGNPNQWNAYFEVILLISNMFFSIWTSWKDEKFVRNILCSPLVLMLYTWKFNAVWILPAS